MPTETLVQTVMAVSPVIHPFFLQLMTAEKRARQEIDELKEHVKTMKENEKKEKRKLADGDALKKIKKYEEQIADLRKELAHHKTVCI